MTWGCGGAIMDERKLSADWADLQDADRVPERGKGTTADRIERDKTRKRKRYPTEDRRAGRVIGPTLPAELVDRLREICKAAGYTRRDGTGKIASVLVEDLLRFAVDAYDRGELQRVEAVSGYRLQPDENHDPGGVR